jgi:hypothetical protein
MLRDRRQGSPTFKSRSLGYPELPLLLPRRDEDITGIGGSTASTFGTENTSFVTGWPIRRRIAKSEEDWSTGFERCITSESSAGAVENQNGSDLIPGDEPVLACLGTADDGLLPKLLPSRAAFCDGWPARSPFDDVGDRHWSIEEQGPECSPIPGAGRDLGRGDFVKVDCAGRRHVALLLPEFLLRFGLNPGPRCST